MKFPTEIKVGAKDTKRLIKTNTHGQQKQEWNGNLNGKINYLKIFHLYLL